MLLLASRAVKMQEEQQQGVIVCPGDRLGRADEFVSGRGTHVRDGVIYASVVGYQLLRPRAAAADGDVDMAEGQQQGQQIQQQGAAQEGPDQVVEVTPAGVPLRVPRPGDLVSVKVTRVQPTSANCLIMCVGSQALKGEFRGVIRQQDVRATEIDKVVMYDCFRPGDIVRCEVLSFGDARSVYLTTAKDNLGVVWAKSVAGFEMTPTSWTTMTCSVTAAVEKRKVAARAAGTA